MYQICNYYHSLWYTRLVSASKKCITFVFWVCRVFSASFQFLFHIFMRTHRVYDDVSWRRPNLLFFVLCSVYLFFLLLLLLHAVHGSDFKMFGMHNLSLCIESWKSSTYNFFLCVFLVLLLRLPLQIVCRFFLVLLCVLLYVPIQKWFVCYAITINKVELP